MSKKDLKHTEQELLFQTEGLIGVGSWMYNVQTSEIYWSPGVRAIHEVDQNYIPNIEDAINFFPEEARKLVKIAVDVAIAMGKPWDLELPFITANGKKLWVRAVGKAFYKDGQVTKLIGSFQDITRSKRAEIELQVQKMRFEAASNAGKLGIWEWDLIKDRSFFNARWFKILGYKQNSIAMNIDSFINLVHPEQRKKFSEEFKNCINSRKSQFESELKILTAENTWRWIYFTGKIIEYEHHKKALRFVGVNMDIHERKLLEEQLIKIGQEAQGANKAKDNFLAMMSHEIRTPLNGIIGMADLLLDTELVEQQQEFAKALVSSGKHLLNIVNDVLDFSKIDNAALEVELRPFSLKTLLNDLELIMQGNFREKEIVYLCDFSSEISDNLVSDAHRIKQILLNLLSNASKFTPETGAIILHIEIVDKSDSKITLRFDVCDTGTGIPEDKQQMIFDAFSQADSSVSRVYGGTGLGLSISKKLAELLGGDVSLTSRIGVGSVFTLTLPFMIHTGKLNTEEKKTIEVDPTSQFNILVAEDNLVNQKIIMHMLKKKGHQVALVENGQKLLERLESESFDLILLDIQMPVMDGEEAFKILKTKPSRPPVIALSAHASREHEEHFMEIGMEGFVSKPIEKDCLFDTICSVVKSAKRGKEDSPLRH